MSKNSIPNIWTAQEKITQLYRWLSAALGLLCAIAIGISVFQSFRNPIVVIRSQGAQEFYPTDRKRTAIEKADVEVFAKQFLASLYAWKDFDGGKIAREIAPYSEDALVTKVVDAQTQRYVKDLKGKKIAQAITFVEVEVLDDRVKCRFDRILKIDGLPLLIPTEVSLSVIQGEQTRVNPMGVFVTGITENSNAK